MGQLLDMASTTGVEMTHGDILTVAERKTAYYSFQLPLETGALLAGASHDAIGPLAQYAVHAGIAFQLRDDVLGMFGDAKKMGKSVMSDLTEGKQTLLIKHALQNGDAAQQSTLRQALGNTELTDETFADCQQILIETGALQATEDWAAREAAQAHDALDTCPAEWPCSQIDFLRAVVSHSITRNV
jgi:geranylgeranyl pyrophosphate synthase